MEAATFRQILPHTHASRLTPAWGQTARKQFIPHADAAFLSLDRIRSTSTCSGSSSRLGAASTAVYGVRVHPVRAGAAGPTASPTGPARPSGNLRCQAGALVHLGAVLQALAAICQFPESWRNDPHLQDALECLHHGQDATARRLKAG